ncbi:hypothetical protein [Roseibacillus persicicus]|uniref:Tetratricopeptide repeat protein n=1 Tax=Roseibacillus persicicus TaxID=454148 RepID=A0A918WI63_9BACT|nr:hypothetical protein [Roseibacillus persicicus]GHC48641.1 hypothetical protein GCM10007100_13200 [Roseibacillus persicicus]
MRNILTFLVIASLGIPSIKAQSLEEVEVDPKLAQALDVFSEEKGAEPVKVPKAIRQYFNQLSKATRKKKELDATRFLSATGLFNATKEAGAFEGVAEDKVRAIEMALPTAINAMSAPLKMLAYDKFKVLRIEKLEAGQRIVYVRLYDNELNVTTPMRWWLVKEEDIYRAYDFEDLSVGLRTTSIMTAALIANMGDKVPEWFPAVMAVVVPMQTLDMGDPDSWVKLEKPIFALAETELPDDFRNFASVMKVAVFQVKGEVQGALEELAAARQEGFDCPMWHYLKGSVLSADENYDEAIEEFASHAKLFGWDSDVLEMVSDCYYELGDMEHAREAALRGLKDNPLSWACAASLAASSNLMQIREEIPGIFKQGRDEEVFYESALDYLLDLEENEKAKVLYSVFQKAVGESDLFEYYDEVFADLEE